MYGKSSYLYEENNCFILYRSGKAVQDVQKLETSRNFLESILTRFYRRASKLASSIKTDLSKTGWLRKEPLIWTFTMFTT